MSIANLWIYPSLDLRLTGCVLTDLGLALRADSLWIHPSLDLQSSPLTSHPSKPQLDPKDHHIQCLGET